MPSLHLRFLPFSTALLLVPAIVTPMFAATTNSTSQTTNAPADVAARRQQLSQLLDEQWQYTMRESPEFATIIGDLRYNDKVSDFSLAHVEKQRKDAEDFLKRFEAIDTAGFPEQEVLNKQLMVRNLKESLEDISLKLYLMPEDQFGGVHLQLAEFVPMLPFDNTKEYEDYLARLHKIPVIIDQVIGTLQEGKSEGMMPPAFLLDKVVTQTRSIGEPAGEASAFGTPIKKFPDAVPAADQKRLHDAIVQAIDTEVRPAYTKLADYIAKDYAPFGRKEPGLWALPNGDALYRYAVKQQTTTAMDPQAIHELGLKEVERIHVDMLVIAKQQGFSDLKSFQASLKTNPKLIPTSREDILNTYRGYIAGMQPELPKLFGLLPKTKVEVKPVQEYREKEAAAAEYNQGTPDGSRPGVVYVNTGDFAHRSKLTMESTSYHEAIPGHHMQISIAQTLPGLPPFRQQGGYTAYVEGWALYSERLGKDIGFYKDPLSDYGRLSDELLRACRLVLDTGVHYKHWTREQMVSYFRENSNEDDPDIQAETDRYIAMPGQALAYKLGQLKILELRARAEKELGPKYDIRAFHDEILDGGALPLDVLDARTTGWIESVKAGTVPAHPQPRQLIVRPSGVFSEPALLLRHLLATGEAHMSQDKKVALITGANRGIGFETAKQLGEKGVTVVLGSRKLSDAEAAAGKLKAAGIDAYPVKLDVTNAADRTAAAQYLQDKFGKLDILINNAGVASSHGFKPVVIDTEEAELQTIFQTNVFSVVAITRELLPLLKKSQAGRIVNLSSILGSSTLHADPNSPIYGFKSFAYDASKSALNAFTTHLAWELKDTPIKVNSAHPGWVKTEMGTDAAPMEIPEGAKTSVELALIGADGPHGRFIHLGQELPW